MRWKYPHKNSLKNQRSSPCIRDIPTAALGHTLAAMKALQPAICRPVVSQEPERRAAHVAAQSTKAAPPDPDLTSCRVFCPHLMTGHVEVRRGACVNCKVQTSTAKFSGSARRGISNVRRRVFAFAQFVLNVSSTARRPSATQGPRASALGLWCSRQPWGAARVLTNNRHIYCSTSHLACPMEAR